MVGFSLVSKALGPTIYETCGKVGRYQILQIYFYGLREHFETQESVEE